MFEHYGFEKSVFSLGYCKVLMDWFTGSRFGKAGALPGLNARRFLT